MSESIAFSYFTGNESEMLTFYRIPKLLIIDPHFRTLSSDAKILYGLMLDRMSLSARNGWIDRENHVYIFFSIEDAMELLGCGRNKAIKTMAELDTESGIGLIERKKRGQGKPAQIYVKNFAVFNGGSASEVYKSNFKKSQNQTSGSPEFKLLEVYKKDPNKNEENKTEDSKIQSHLSQEMEGKDKTGKPSDVAGYSDLIRKNIELDVLFSRYPLEKDIISEIYQLVLETILSSNNQIQIAGNCYPADFVKSRFMQLRFDHIEYVLGRLRANTTKVRNIKKYLLTSLFNAPATIGNYYWAEVNYDEAHAL